MCNSAVIIPVGLADIERARQTYGLRREARWTGGFTVGVRRRGIKEFTAILHAVLPVTLRPSDTRVLRFVLLILSPHYDYPVGCIWSTFNRLLPPPAGNNFSRQCREVVKVRKNDQTIFFWIFCSSFRLVVFSWYSN